MSKIYLTKIPQKAVFFLFLNLAHPLLPHVQYLIQKSKKKTKKTFFCLFPNVAPPILPDVRNLIRKIPKKTFYLSLSQMSQPRFCLCPKLISKKQITLFFCLFVNVAPLLVLLPYVRNLIQKIPQKAKKYLFCLFLQALNSFMLATDLSEYLVPTPTRDPFPNPPTRDPYPTPLPHPYS